MVSKFKIAECTEVGTYHKSINHVCQDAVGKYETENCAVVVLCDGAGSIENSEKDSKYVCDHFPEYIASHFDELYCMSKSELVEKVSNQIKIYKRYCNLHCTMLSVCMHQDGRCLVLHVGDGMIFGEDEKGFQLISNAENGSESYITFFLSSDHLQDHLRVSKKSCNSFFLTSDGLSDLLYSKQSVMNAVSIMVNWLKEYDACDVEEKYKQEMQELFSERTQDDMSIAIILREEDN